MRPIKLAQCWLAAIIFLSPSLGWAQQALQHDSGTWAFLFSKVRLTNSLSAQLEISPRVGNQFSQIQSILIRPSMILQIDERFQGSVGYLYLPRWDSTGPIAAEHRVWEQLQAKLSLGPVVLLPRMRLEQRIRDVQGSSQVAHRFRALLRSQVPVLKFDSDLKPGEEPKTLSIVVFDELFLNLGDSSGWTKSGFDQNRVFSGLNFSFLPGTSIEIGYMNQLVQNFFPDVFFRMNHLLISNFTVVFN